MFQSFTGQSPFKHSHSNLLHSSIEQIHRAHHTIPLPSGVALDAQQLAQLRETAQTRVITSQVVKQSLYESVVKHRLLSKRRYSISGIRSKQRPLSVHGRDDNGVGEGGGGGGRWEGEDGWKDDEGREVWREVQSMPVSPCLSPRSASKRFCSSLMDDEEEDKTVVCNKTPLASRLNLSRTSLLLSNISNDTNTGLCAILKPIRPRFIPSNTDLTNLHYEDDDGFKKPTLPLQSRLHDIQNVIGQDNPANQKLEPISSGSSLGQSTIGSQSQTSLVANQGPSIDYDDDYDNCDNDVSFSANVDNNDDKCHVEPQVYKHQQQHHHLHSNVTHNNNNNNNQIHNNHNIHNNYNQNHNNHNNRNISCSHRNHSYQNNNNNNVYSNDDENDIEMQ